MDPFEGEGNAQGLHAPTVRDVQLCLGLDKGGLISSCKAFLSIANQEHPCSRGNTILSGVFPCQKGDYAALSSVADVYGPDIDELRASGVQVDGQRRAVRLILTGDYSFTTTWCGHMGASSRMPCLYCTVMRRRTRRNGRLIGKFGDMQDGSRAGGALRTQEQFERMAVAYADGNNDSQAVPLSLTELLSIERRPLIILPPSHISAMPLHLTLGVAQWLLRLGIEAAYFFQGLERATCHATSLTGVLWHSVGVRPVPYFGGAFEGRQCQRIGRRLSLICELLSVHVPQPAL